jgi:hypothetical protein
MGISSLPNGIVKHNSKISSPRVNGNGTGKRKPESSDSEEDSKSKLVTKLSSKKSDTHYKKPIGSTTHEAIARQSPILSIPSNRERSNSSSKSPSVSPVSKYFVAPSVVDASLPRSPELLTSNEIRDEEEKEAPKVSKEERKRLKKEKKEERKRRKKLEKEKNKKSQDIKD